MFLRFVSASCKLRLTTVGQQEYFYVRNLNLVRITHPVIFAVASVLDFEAVWLFAYFKIMNIIWVSPYHFRISNQWCIF